MAALTPPVQPLFLTDYCPTLDADQSAQLISEDIHYRANAVTSVLKEIMSHTGYTHGGLNE